MGPSVASQPSQHLEIWARSTAGRVSLGSQAVTLRPQQALSSTLRLFPPLLAVLAHVLPFPTVGAIFLLTLKLQDEKTQAMPISLHGSALKYDFGAFASVTLIAAN